MKTGDLVMKREVAGGRYQAALQEFREAMIDLAAIEGALQGRTTEDVNSFGPLPNITEFRHPRFAPDVAGHLPSDVTEQRNRYLEKIQRGEA